MLFGWRFDHTHIGRRMIANRRNSESSRGGHGWGGHVSDCTRHLPVYFFFCYNTIRFNELVCLFGYLKIHTLISLVCIVFENSPLFSFFFFRNLEEADLMIFDYWILLAVVFIIDFVVIVFVIIIKIMSTNSIYELFRLLFSWIVLLNFFFFIIIINNIFSSSENPIYLKKNFCFCCCWVKINKIK